MNTQIAGELSESLAAYGKELSELWPSTFYSSVTGTPIEFYPLVCDEIERLWREAISNAFKHSQGSNVVLEIAYLAREFRMQARDDKVGIEPRFVTEGPSHWGMQNMRERAQKIGRLSMFPANLKKEHLLP
jgi:signal transduction histidine kinase